VTDPVPLDKLLGTFINSTPIAVIDTLVSYRFSSDHDDAQSFLRKVIDDFVEDVTAPPPVWSMTRTKECEICEREVPLTYHHLIPRSVHDLVLKQGWHVKEMLGSVAWLCRSVMILCLFEFGSLNAFDLGRVILRYTMWRRMRSWQGNILRWIGCLREKTLCGGGIMLQNSGLVLDEGDSPCFEAGEMTNIT
jgi:hypothetical protein